MSEVTRILSAIENGDPTAAAQLLPLVYDELRRMAAAKLAQERKGHSLNATALVHEAYLRLVGADHRVLFESAEQEAPGFAFVVHSMTIDFRRPARMDDVLEVITEPQVVKGASITLRQRVMRGDELLVEAHVRVAFISEGRARPIPKPLRIAMKAEHDTLQA